MNNIDNQHNQSSDNDVEKLKSGFFRFFILLINYLKEVINIRDGVDVEGSMDSIKKDIDFKGVNIWILGASIAIASIGLNVNSSAVIIGAMLISPLMGPIVGIGLAIGINNLMMLKRSLKSLGTAVFISVVVSTVYFLITPFGEVQSELIARTRPTLLDVLIAFFGGITLIVAKTKKGTVASAIFGVAIATALMPPLCTAGYGLANGNWQFFFGAFYLFLINSVFIILATWLIVKYLKFPLVAYIDEDKQKKVKRFIFIFILLISIPSSISFWNSIQENIFKSNAENFIADNFNFEESEVIEKRITYKIDDEQSFIEIYILGKSLDVETEKKLHHLLGNYDLQDAKLKIYQSKDNSSELASKLSSEVKSGIIEEIYQKNEELVKDKDKKINLLETQLNNLMQHNLPYEAIKNEIKVQYKEIELLEFGTTISTNFNNTQDTSTTFLIQWNNSINEKEKNEKKNTLQNWLRVRLNDEKVKVINY